MILDRNIAEVYFSSPPASQGMGDAAFDDSGHWARSCRAVPCQRCPHALHVGTITSIQPVPLQGFPLLCMCLITLGFDFNRVVLVQPSANEGPKFSTFLSAS